MRTADPVRRKRLIAIRVLIGEMAKAWEQGLTAEQQDDRFRKLNALLYQEFKYMRAKMKESNDIN